MKPYYDNREQNRPLSSYPKFLFFPTTQCISWQNNCRMKNRSKQNLTKINTKWKANMAVKSQKQ